MKSINRVCPAKNIAQDKVIEMSYANKKLLFEVLMEEMQPVFSNEKLFEYQNEPYINENFALLVNNFPVQGPQRANFPGSFSASCKLLVDTFIERK